MSWSNCLSTSCRRDGLGRSACRREAQRDQARRDAASLRAELGAARALCGNLAAQLREVKCIAPHSLGGSASADILL